MQLHKKYYHIIADLISWQLNPKSLNQNLALFLSFSQKPEAKFSSQPNKHFFFAKLRLTSFQPKSY